MKLYQRNTSLQWRRALSELFCVKECQQQKNTEPRNHRISWARRYPKQSLSSTAGLMGQYQLEVLSFFYEIFTVHTKGLPLYRWIPALPHIGLPALYYWISLRSLICSLAERIFLLGLHWELAVLLKTFWLIGAISLIGTFWTPILSLIQVGWLKGSVPNNTCPSQPGCSRPGLHEKRQSSPWTASEALPHQSEAIRKLGFFSEDIQMGYKDVKAFRLCWQVKSISLVFRHKYLYCRNAQSWAYSSSLSSCILMQMMHWRWTAQWLPIPAARMSCWV